MHRTARLVVGLVLITTFVLVSILSGRWRNSPAGDRSKQSTLAERVASPGKEDSSEREEEQGGGLAWRASLHGGSSSPRAILNALSQRERLLERQLESGAGPGFTESWEYLGPDNVPGRVRALVIHPDTPDIMWAGTATGGIWKTTDAGQSWQPMGDFPGLIAVSCMVIDPNDPDVLYAGTGERQGSLVNTESGASLGGAGVFKSIDGGVTWQSLAGTTDLDWKYVNELAIDPRTGMGDHLFAATNAGLFETSNGGTFWNTILGGGFASMRVDDIQWHPDGLHLIASHEDGMISSFDAGASWTPWSAMLTQLPRGDRTELSYGPDQDLDSDGNIDTVVYASIYTAADDLFADGRSEIWRSLDNGLNWELRNDQLEYMGSQGVYGNSLWAVSSNANVVMVGGIDLWLGYDGGEDPYHLSSSDDLSPHADQHVIVPHPDYDGQSNKTVFVANDGGIYRAPNIFLATPTSGWERISDGLGCTQFYRGTVLEDGTIIGGTQDNGTLLLPPGGDSSSWTKIQGGDGAFCVADPQIVNDTATVFVETQYLGLARYVRTSGGSSIQELYGNPSLGRYLRDHYDLNRSSPRAAFIAPLVLDPNDPKRLLAGGQSLWENVDATRGSQAVEGGGASWQEIRTPIGEERITAIAIDPNDSSRVWTAYTGQLVFYRDAGAWIETSVPEALGEITNLVLDPSTSGGLFLTYGGYNASVDLGSLFYSADNGASWANMAGEGPMALPRDPVYDVFVNSPCGHLYAATETGVYYSEDYRGGAPTWKSWPDGPTNVPVYDLGFQDDMLYAFTHGRGVYRIPLAPSPPGEDLVSAKPDGTESAEGESLHTMGDHHDSTGNFVTFYSSADDLAAGDTVDWSLLLRDRAAGTTEVVSLDDSGTQPASNGLTSYCGMSADGRYVIFGAHGDYGEFSETTTNRQAFRRDRLLDQLDAVHGAGASDELPDRPIFFWACSSDGNKALLFTNATNLVSPAETNNNDEYWMYDFSTETAEKVSPSDLFANGFADKASMSSDGRFVVFDGYEAGNNEIYVRDMSIELGMPGALVNVHVDADGVAGDGTVWGRLRISDDGRYVAFTSDSKNLIVHEPNETDSDRDLFLHDRDLDGDGVFDEPGEIDTLRLTDANELGIWGVVLADLSSTGTEVLYYSVPIANEPEALHSIDVSSGTDTPLGIRRGPSSRYNATFVGGNGPGFVVGTDEKHAPGDNEPGGNDVYIFPCGK